MRRDVVDECHLQPSHRVWGGGLVSVAVAAMAFSGVAVECVSLNPMHLAAIDGVATTTTAQNNRGLILQ